METRHAETGITMNITLKCQWTWKSDSNELAYDSNSTTYWFKTWTKSRTALSSSGIYESSFWTSNEVYRTKRLTVSTNPVVTRWHKHVPRHAAQTDLLQMRCSPPEPSATDIIHVNHHSSVQCFLAVADAYVFHLDGEAQAKHLNIALRWWLSAGQEMAERCIAKAECFLMPTFQFRARSFFQQTDPNYANNKVAVFYGNSHVCTFVPVFGENRPTPFIRRAGIPKRVGGLQCRWLR